MIYIFFNQKRSTNLQENFFFQFSI